MRRLNPSSVRFVSGPIIVESDGTVRNDNNSNPITQLVSSILTRALALSDTNDGTADDTRQEQDEQTSEQQEPAEGGSSPGGRRRRSRRTVALTEDGTPLASILMMNQLMHSVLNPQREGRTSPIEYVVTPFTYCHHSLLRFTMNPERMPANHPFLRALGVSGNIGDYAFGPNGLDAIIDRLREMDPLYYH